MQQRTKTGGRTAPGVSGLGSKKPKPAGRAREKATKLASGASRGSVFIELGENEYQGAPSSLTFKRLKEIRRILEKEQAPLPLADVVSRVGGESPKERKRVRATVQDLIRKGVLTRTG